MRKTAKLPATRGSGAGRSAIYLVRTIQKHEKAAWVAKLGSDPRCFLPLPFMPKHHPPKIAVIHGDDVYEFDRDRIVPHTGPIPVGHRGSVVIDAKALVYVKTGPLRTGKRLIRGFTGIRYKSKWTQIAV